MGFWLAEEWNNEPPRRKERQGEALCQLAIFMICDRRRRGFAHRAFY
ncbi:hypothetical protein [Anabaena sp. CCY 0017]